MCSTRAERPTGFKQPLALQPFELQVKYKFANLPRVYQSISVGGEVVNNFHTGKYLQVDCSFRELHELQIKGDGYHYQKMFTKNGYNFLSVFCKSEKQRFLIVQILFVWWLFHPLLIEPLTNFQCLQALKKFEGPLCNYKLFSTERDNFVLDTWIRWFSRSFLVLHSLQARLHPVRIIYYMKIINLSAVWHLRLRQPFSRGTRAHSTPGNIKCEREF